ncbi:unnamed protein product [Eruca vesicaria subsp. sativa]|uniref:S-protein homolog n=1 Tax=Eruca vesicaria subsp. sativa TaxID=29727 RepID=A0ABC8L1T9_ERUVS|nr:unnamed protein product [Eruca vesicaria subsp. sativa]
MNLRLSCFLIIIALCAELSNGAIFQKDSVHFNNSLQPNNILKVHCVTKEDDLGDHLLSHGQTYEFSFYESIFKTEVICGLWQGPGFKLYALLKAYEGAGFHYGKTNYWDAREDGVYFTHGSLSPKLEYKWKWLAFVLAPTP